MTHKHTLSISREIEFCDTDAAGMMHFSTYFRFMEAAEAALFKKLNLPLLQSDSEHTTGFPRVDVQCRFLKPLHFGDLVEICLTLESVQDNRINFGFLFYGFQNDKRRKVAEGSMTTIFAKMDSSARLRPASLPHEWLAKLK